MPQLSTSPRRWSTDSEASRQRLYESVKDSSEKNRTFFIAWLFFAAYVATIVFSTTDIQLVIPESRVALPVLGAELPLLSFYLVTPLLVFIVHFNLIQNLETHAHKLERWRASWQNLPPRVQLPAFLFDLAMLERGGSFSALVRWGNQLLCYWLGPIAIGVLLVRFSDYQNQWHTSWHLLVFFADVVCAAYALNALPQFASRSLRVRRLQVASTLSAICIPVFWTVWMVWALAMDATVANNFMRDSRYDQSLSFLSELLMPRLTVPTNAQLTQIPSDIERRARIIGQSQEDWWKQYGQGISLQGRSLRYAVFRGANLAKADLKNVKATGANFAFAQLQDSALWKADFRDALFDGAHLERAEFQESDIRGSDFTGANLQAAYLMNVQSAGAWFGPDMGTPAADLRGATLYGSFQGADFTQARLEGASLSRANLNGATLRSTNLLGADLDSTQLKGAVFEDANVLGAQMDNVSLSRFSNWNGVPFSFSVSKDSNIEDWKGISEHLPFRDLSASAERAVAPPGPEFEDASRVTAWLANYVLPQTVTDFTNSWCSVLAELKSVATIRMMWWNLPPSLRRPEDLPIRKKFADLVIHADNCVPARAALCEALKDEPEFRSTAIEACASRAGTKLP